MKTVEIKLFDPFEHHNKTIETIVVKEPTGGAFAQHGEPRIWVKSASGGYWVEQPDVIRRYLDLCLDHADGSDLLGLMSLTDVMEVKDTVMGFFSAAEARIVARKHARSSSAPSA